jgi:hypothetical protein
VGYVGTGRGHHRDYLNVFNHEAGGSIFLRNFGGKLPTCTVSKASTNDRNRDSDGLRMWICKMRINCHTISRIETSWRTQT